MFTQKMFFVAFVFVMFTAGLSFSAENETLSQQTKEIVTAAHAYVQAHLDDMDAVQKAFMTDPKYRDDGKELYVYLYGYDPEKGEAICLAHGARAEFLGKNLWNLRSPNGRYLFQELYALVEKEGEGWLEYEWLNPYSKKVQTKKSYVMKVVLKDGRTAGLGCGFWK